MYMDLPYVIMLTIASVFTLYLCINYLHVQSSITARMHHIEKELGMVYAKKDQVLLYDKTESEYVRQYEDIPEH